MLTRYGNLHLEIQTSRKNPVGILRTSFRDPASGKNRRTRHGRLTGCTIEQLRVLRPAFRLGVLPAGSPQAVCNLKTVQLEMPPFYRHKDDRTRGHAFLCTLAHCVQWHMAAASAGPFKT